MYLIPNLDLIKMAVDGFLIASIVYLAFRFAKASSPEINATKIASLESSLRVLIHEAKLASTSLNDELQTRQQSLEKLLFELGTSEYRLNKAVTEAEHQKATLDAELNKARLAAVEKNMTAEEQWIRPQSRVEQVAPEEAAFSQQDVDEYEQEASNLKTEDSFEEPNWRGVNIYGEPIAASPAPVQKNQPPKVQAKAKSRLTAAVEKEVEPNQALDAYSSAQSVQQVYDAAEQMLRAGQSLQAVANKTRIPEDELRVLKSLVDQEASIHERPTLDPEMAGIAARSMDPRLGVLGRTTGRAAAVVATAPGIKRQVQTL